MCCITDLMDHVIDESTAVYSGTDKAESFHIYHDALTLWWGASAQAYLKTRNFYHRQLMCTGSTNNDNRYKNKLVGDSPEFCRGLDSHGFADLKRSINLHCALSSVYPVDDIRRFKLGTPNEVWHAIERCWSIDPTSERIIEDISNFPIALSKIIDESGCVVQDLFLRTGRRHRRADDKGFLKSKPRASSRKATIMMPTIHAIARMPWTH